MKFLCLAYGDEAGWNSLNEEEKREVLAQDAVIRGRGNLMSAVQRTVTSVKIGVEISKSTMSLSLGVSFRSQGSRSSKPRILMRSSSLYRIHPVLEQEA